MGTVGWGGWINNNYPYDRGGVSKRASEGMGKGPDYVRWGETGGDMKPDSRTGAGVGAKVRWTAKYIWRQVAKGISGKGFSYLVELRVASRHANGYKGPTAMYTDRERGMGGERPSGERVERLDERRWVREMGGGSRRGDKRTGRSCGERGPAGGAIMSLRW